MRLNLMLAAVLAATLALPAVAAEPPEPPPPPPPPPPGMSQADADGMRVLRSDLSRHLIQTRRNGAWPSTTMVPISGMSLTDFTAFTDDAMRNGGMIDIAGQFTGPGNLVLPVSLTLRDNQGSRSQTLAPNVWTVFSTRADGGAIDLAGGIRREGESHIGSIEAVGSGAPFTLDLGDGYRLRATARYRPANDDERRINVLMADALKEARSLREAGGADEAATPSAPVAFSAFTNSVIREGDPRARPEAE